jgi:hypothetical protein
MCGRVIQSHLRLLEAVTVSQSAATAQPRDRSTSQGPIAMPQRSYLGDFLLKKYSGAGFALQIFERFKNFAFAS